MRRGLLIASLVCFGIAGLLIWVMVGQAQQSVNLPLVLQRYHGAPLKGLSVVRSCRDLATLRASWFLDWSYPPSPSCAGAIGMVCCKGSTISYDAGFTGYLLGPNEANIAEQGNMSLQELVAKIRYIEQQRPNAKIVSPALFMYAGYGRPDYTYTYTQVVQEYRRQFGTDPRWVAIAIHAYDNDPSRILGWIDYVTAELDAAGMGYLPLWLSEWGCWPGNANPQWVMQNVMTGLQQRPRITRYAWFPARPAVDSAGVGWDDTSLLDKNGALRPLGRVYAAY